eukprot:ANDGO_00331.mRNA.1 Myb-like protein M
MLTASSFEPVESSSSNKRVKRKASVKWTSDEDERLRAAVAVYGGKEWSQIAAFVATKDKVACYQHWFRVLHPQISKAKFTDSDYCALAWRVKVYGTSAWCKIAEGMPGRTDTQCRARWLDIVKGTTAVWRRLRVCVLGEVADQIDASYGGASLPPHLVHLPNAVMTADEMKDILSKEFGFSAPDPVAPALPMVSVPSHHTSLPMLDCGGGLSSSSASSFASASATASPVSTCSCCTHLERESSFGADAMRVRYAADGTTPPPVNLCLRSSWRKCVETKGIGIPTANVASPAQSFHSSNASSNCSTAPSTPTATALAFSFANVRVHSFGNSAASVDAVCSSGSAPMNIASSSSSSSSSSPPTTTPMPEDMGACFMCTSKVSAPQFESFMTRKRPVSEQIISVAVQKHDEKKPKLATDLWENEDAVMQWGLFAFEEPAPEVPSYSESDSQRGRLQDSPSRIFIQDTMVGSLSAAEFDWMDDL